MAQIKPIILLDRDGVINQDSDAYVKSVEEWQPIPGSIKSIAALSKAGFNVFVVTNQSGIARGYYDDITLQAMHDKMIALVEAEGGTISGIQYCPHGPDDNCHCRKPKSGMIENIEAELGLSFEEHPAIMVGDSLRDLQAGNARGCSPVLVLTGKGRETQYKAIDFPFAVYTDLAAFTIATLHKYS
ncbi:D,D-heptose 1,7-bisphosphate phosphatase [Marinomonas pontica]|uniref:D,D-heptose 1,7-bisphosphate phosphatase n=1 Tax=Marinomonas pontica TaxID=264739 RepID=A0ABM8FAU3_9GAMM|nr:D-glycero-beta-D-manno-heptose 1,7-bisphosphate 7-phosphatase [Marinomonas pontica]MCW8354657.1 D-glycero-beta-D-manno-heptose 1,7-bisphosphate 7-phosphatase [Marinomonas pontica]BDX01296.1 D,D-heptose 1,7-bisphosphate phosphatase [Marinomonas pontica]